MAGHSRVDRPRDRARPGARRRSRLHRHLVRPPGKIGRLQYGSPVMHVAGDQAAEHELVTIGYDGVENGIYIFGDKSWSIDMRRYNFQSTGQRFYKIEHGRLTVTPAIGRNLMLDGGGFALLDEMIGRTGRGLLLTCLWCSREVDPQKLLLTRAHQGRHVPRGEKGAILG